MKQFALLLVLTLSAIGQILTPTAVSTAASAPKEPTAITIATRSLAAMGRPDKNTSLLLSGALTLNSATPKSFPVVIKSYGTDQIRTEISMGAGTRVYIASRGHGLIRNADGSVRWITDENMVSQRATHLPALSQLAETDQPNVSVQLAGADTFQGTQVDVIATGLYQGANDTEAKDRAFKTRTMFYIGRDSGYVLGLKQRNYSENVRGQYQELELRFSDYRNVNGVMVPFRQQTYLDGVLFHELVIESATFGVSIADTDFDLKEKQSQ